MQTVYSRTTVRSEGTSRASSLAWGSAGKVIHLYTKRFMRDKGAGEQIIRVARSAAGLRHSFVPFVASNRDA